MAAPGPINKDIHKLSMRTCVYVCVKLVSVRVRVHESETDQNITIHKSSQHKVMCTHKGAHTRNSAYSQTQLPSQRRDVVLMHATRPFPPFVLFFFTFVKCEIVKCTEKQQNQNKNRNSEEGHNNNAWLKCTFWITVCSKFERQNNNCSFDRWLRGWANRLKPKPADYEYIVYINNRNDRFSLVGNKNAKQNKYWLTVAFRITHPKRH